MKSYALGADINDFYNNHFPEDCYCDDISEYIIDNGTFWVKTGTGYDLALLEDKQYSLDDMGIIITNDDKCSWDFSEKFLEWQDKQHFTTFVVKVPKTMESVVKERITAIDPMIEILED